MFSARNVKLLGLCVGLLIVGYIFLGQGPVFNPISWTIAPLLLVAVYCIMIPWAIITKDKKTRENKGV